MSSYKVYLLWGLLISTAAALVGLNGCGGEPAKNPPHHLHPRFSMSWLFSRKIARPTTCFMIQI